MKTLYYLLGVLVLFSTCSEGKKICGEYHSKYSDNYKSSKFTYVTGTILTLNHDSSFKMTTCGNIIEGNWLNKNDSVILISKSNKYRNDSLAKIKKPLTLNKFVLIKNGKKELMNIIDSNFNGHILVDILKME